MTNPSKRTNPLDYPSYVRGLRPAMPESLGQYVDDELEKLQNSVDNLNVAVDENAKAKVQVEKIEREEADETLASQITTIEATFEGEVGDLTAMITDESTARATADEALAEQITTITAEVDDNTAAISAEATARATADGAISSTVSTLSATVATNTAAISANTSAITTEATARATADTALASSITSLTSTVSGNTSAISTEASTRASADSALSSTITSLTSTVSGVSASVTTEASTRAAADTALGSRATTIEARYSVVVSAGKMTGFQLISGGTTSDFIVQADRFKIVNSSGSGDVPFEVLGGVTYIKDAKIQNAAIDTLKIGTGAVTTAKVDTDAISRTIAAFTSGTITIPTGSGTWTDGQYLSITTRGGPVKVDINFHSYWKHATNASAGRYRLIRQNLSTLAATSVLGPVDMNSAYDASVGGPAIWRGANSFSIVDEPPAGNWAYYYQFEQVGCAYCTVYYRALAATELLR